MERKSNSGVVSMLGSSTLEKNRQRRGVTSLSCGVAEMNARAQAAACGTPLQQFFAEGGCLVTLRAHADSTAACGTTTRGGSSVEEEVAVDGENGPEANGSPR